MPEREQSKGLLNSHISRRGLLKGAARGTLVLASGVSLELLASGCGGGIPEFSNKPERKYPLVWKKEYGSGGVTMEVNNTVGLTRKYQEDTLETLSLNPQTGEEIKRSYTSLPRFPNRSPHLKKKSDLDPIVINTFDFDIDERITFNQNTAQEWELPEDYIYPRIYAKKVVISRNAVLSEKADKDEPFFSKHSHTFYGAFDWGSGEKLWEEKFRDFSGFQLHETGFYAYEGDSLEHNPDLKIIKMDLYTGERIWETGNFSNSEFARIHWGDNNFLLVYANKFGSDDSKYITLNTNDGEPVGTLSLKGANKPHSHLELNTHKQLNVNKNYLIEFDKTNGNLRLENSIDSQIVKLGLKDGLLFVLADKIISTREPRDYYDRDWYYMETTLYSYKIT